MQHANWDAIIFLLLWVAGNVALGLFCCRSDRNRRQVQVDLRPRRYRV